MLMNHVMSFSCHGCFEMSLQIHFQTEFLNDRIMHICFTVFIQEPDNIYHTPSQFLRHLVISLRRAINGCFF